MAIVNNSLVEFTLVQSAFNMTMLNVFQYQISLWPGAVNTAQLAEAWWNHIKAEIRATVVNSSGAFFKSVRVLELNNPEGDYGEWNIPSGESAGTRTPPAQSEALPPYCAAAMRLLVTSRATRPGQKRFGLLVEGDQTGGVLNGTMIGLYNTLGAKLSGIFVLGAPAVGTSMEPIVCRKDASGVVSAHQDISGWLVNPNVSTQNTRKFGRGI